jgi:3-oxoacyl-[acyl-carrier protein] reductase
MALRLEGKRAVITGAANGLGRACAERFAQEGAAVVVADQLFEDAEEVVRVINSSGGKAVALQVDTTRDDSNATLAARAVEELGGIDIVVPAAGVAHSGYVTGDLAGNAERQRAAAEDPLGHSFIYQPLEMWDYVMDVNLTGVMLTLRHTLRPMIESGNGGAVVTISSILAKLPVGAPQTHYQVAKAGIWMLTKSMAPELAKHGIRIKSVGPGMFETSMTAVIRADEEAERAVLEQIPMGRMGTPRELADTVLFLVSDESSYFTGQLLIPDGGWLPTV